MISYFLSADIPQAVLTLITQADRAVSSTGANSLVTLPKECLILIIHV